jgi:hypothetical protein
MIVLVVGGQGRTIEDYGDGVDYRFHRHCERSEAIQLPFVEARKLDCFVAEPVIGRAFARPVGSSQ